MSESPICRVCGFPLDQHALEVYRGAAHAVMRGTDGKVIRHCSQAAGDYTYTLGQMAELSTIVRSLRWRAGRLRSQGTVWHNYDLEYWATKIARDIERLQRQIVEHYGWTQED
jgi:hypothetical protein